MCVFIHPHHGKGPKGPLFFQNRPRMHVARAGNIAWDERALHGFDSEDRHEQRASSSILVKVSMGRCSEPENQNIHTAERDKRTSEMQRSSCDAVCRCYVVGISTKPRSCRQSVPRNRKLRGGHRHGYCVFIRWFQNPSPMAFPACCA